MPDGDLIPVALARLAAGYSVIPTKDKIPSLIGQTDEEKEWRRFRTTPMGEAEVRKQWANGSQIAIVCGPSSGNLELLEFDNPDKHDEGYRPHLPALWIEFCELLKAHGEKHILKKCIIERSPSGGVHVIYRHLGEPKGSQKLARGPNKECLIETKADGGYFVCEPSEGYTIMPGCPVTWETLEPISAEDRDILIHAARTFDQYTTLQVYEYNRTVGLTGRASDDFVANGPSIEHILETSIGATIVCRHRGRAYVRRPGKNRGWSATITADGEVFYNFSTNFLPFDSDRGYNKFSVFAILLHNSDFSAAAKAVYAMGYRTAEQREKDIRVATARVKVKEEIDELKPLSSYAIELPSWLMPEWEYIRVKHLNLLDAKGYTGKSSFALGIAALGTMGRTPFGDECEPFKTLYIGKQDHPGEIRFRVESLLAGDPAKLDWIVPWANCPILDDFGMEALERAIEKTGARFTVFDPMKSLFPPYVRNDFDNVGLNRFFDALRQVHARTNTAPLLIRHFPKMLPGRPLSELATGGSEWRDSARAQFVMLPHPDKTNHRTYTGVFPCRGSMNATPGDPFGFTAIHGGGMRYDFPDVFPLETFADNYQIVAEHFGIEEYIPAKKSKGGRPADSARACLEWLVETLEKELSCQLITLRKRADDHGWSAPVLYRAKTISGGLVEEVKGVTPILWKLNRGGD